MHPDVPAPPRIRLATGGVTVLLGSSASRHRVVHGLDGSTTRCGEGQVLRGGTLRVGASPTSSLAERLHAVHVARGARPALVLVDRLTDGLDSGARRTVLVSLRALAADGAAVLVDDEDPVAAVAVASSALRVDADGRMTVDALPDLEV